MVLVLTSTSKTPCAWGKKKTKEHAKYFLCIQVNIGDLPELTLPLNSKCIHCGEGISMAREITLARRTWDLLKPLEVNADTINVERHLPSQFQLSPPKLEGVMFSR